MEDRLLTDLRVPADFLFGVATAAYQVEGELNGHGEPCNNWAPWELEGRVEPAGRANDFWRQPAALLDRAAALGLNGFRLGLEWARLEPAPGQRDAAALAHYVEILLGCRQRGMEPVVTLHHFTHPAWCGESPWIGPDADTFLTRFISHLRGTVEALNLALLAKASPPLRVLVTLNEINILPLASFLLGAFPPGGIADLTSTVAMLDRLACAHVLAYDALHDLYQEHGWTAPLVTTNNYCFGLYELDRLLIDMLTARTRGVGELELSDDLARRRQSWHQHLEEAPRAPGSQRWLELLVRPLAGSLIRQGLPATRAAIYASPRYRKLDAVAIDYYDPFPECCLRWPGRQAGLRRAWQPLASLWETPVNPDGLRWFLSRAAEYGLPVLILENGLCNERNNSQSAPRTDGWQRAAYLRANLLAVAEALRQGVPIAGYFHWTLVDNYEWGSYRPRFGLLGRDERTGAIEELDSMGEASAQVYARLIAALRGPR